MSGIQNLATFGEFRHILFTCWLTIIVLTDPFLDANRGDDKAIQDGLIHIRIQQRSGRKTLTTVQGIAESYDKKKIVKACKKVSLFVGLLTWHNHNLFFLTGVRM